MKFLFDERRPFERKNQERERSEAFLGLQNTRFIAGFLLITRGLLSRFYLLFKLISCGSGF
jgi:hypothetical protein